MKLSAVVLTYNEEHNIEGLIKNLKDCDEIIIADDGSTDKTVKIAEKMGATVFTRDKHIEIATPQDVKDFRERFGWLPKFNEQRNINNGAACRNDAIAHATGEWVFMPDADERVTWNFAEIQKLMLESDQIKCAFIHSRKANGAPESVFQITKLFRKSMGLYKCRIHEVVIPAGRVVETSKMKIDHWQAKGHKQSSVLATLEYSVLKDDIKRDQFYLGREYYYNKEYDRAIRIFDEYLENPEWMQEAVEAQYLKARCLWDSNRGNQARTVCLEAIRQNPDHRAALYLMAEMHFEPWKSKWKRIADNATNKDALF